MNENKLTPSIRFKNNDGENYPEWEFVKVKEIASINTGNKDTKDAVENGQYDFYVRSPIVHKIDSFSYDGEAVLTVGDGVGVGKVFHYVNGKFDFHQRVYKISDFKDYYGLLFYYYFQKNFLKEAQKYNAKTSVDSVRKSMIADMDVPKIEMSEQIKIGNFFSKLDRQIELEEEKLELLEQQKKGYMQKIFSQELRFKDENGNKYPKWTNTLIKDLFINKGGTALEKEFENNGDYKVISIGSYSMNSTYNDQNLRINKNEKTEKYILSQGDLAMVLNDKTKDGNIIGRSIFIDKDNHYIYNQRTERLIPLNENDNKFLWFLMNTDIVRNKIKSMMQGATQVYINYSSIKNISLQIPSFEEQIKIREFLEILLHSITKQDNKVKLLKQRKQGLLQKMFV
ncbi:restriction endonuclease subunit S [Staphylococcus hominis]|nr:restriction endonuclease subunit S [Staphylococcus hominis]MDS3867576.1 restriction endonuclease subunit S [Staphylococcus hominis]